MITSSSKYRAVDMATLTRKHTTPPSAAGNSPSKTMEQELKCPVCEQLFIDPVILQCNHNICLQCAQVLIEDQVQVESAEADDFHRGITRSETLNGTTDNDKISSCHLSCSDSDSGYSQSSTTGTNSESSSRQSVAKLVDNFETTTTITSTTGTLGRRPAAAGCPRSLTMPILPKSIRCISCPVCSRTLFLDDRGAESLQRNSMLGAIVDRFRAAAATTTTTADDSQPRDHQPRQMDRNGNNENNNNTEMRSIVKPSKGDRFCEMCESHPPPVATVRCAQCNVNYCSVCLDTFHPARGPLAKHALTPLTHAAIKRSSSSRGLRGQKPEVPKRSSALGTGSLPRPKSKLGGGSPALMQHGGGAVKPTSCQRHPTESTSLYCNTCQLSICVQCQTDHQSHDLKPIGLTLKIQKSQLSQQMSSLSGKARKAKELVENLRAAQEEIKQNSLQLESKTTAQFGHVIENIERKRDELLNLIARESEMKTKAIREQLQQCTVKLKQTTGLLEYCIEVMKENDPNAFLLVAGNLIERVACAEQQWKPKHLSKKESSEFNLQLDTDPLMHEIEKLDLTKPRAPPAPVVEVDKCSTKNNTVTIGWKLPLDERSSRVVLDGYKLEMDDGFGGTFREVYCGLETLCTVDGLHFNSTYRARVRSCNMYGQSSYCKEIHLRTAEVAAFQFEVENKLSNELEFTNNNTTLTNHGSDVGVFFGNVGFSKGSHYWQFSVGSFKPGAAIGFGIARADVSRSSLLGQDNCGWAIHCEADYSWHVHAGHSTNKMDKGIRKGSVVGLFLHFGTKTLTFFLDGQQHGDPINFYSHHRKAPSIFYPVVSLNESSQVTLHTGIHCPQNHISIQEQQIYRAKIRDPCEKSQTTQSQIGSSPTPSLHGGSYCNGMSLLRNMTTPSMRRGNSAGDMNSISSGDSCTTVTSDPTPELNSFRSFFKRR